MLDMLMMLGLAAAFAAAALYVWACADLTRPADAAAEPE